MNCNALTQYLRFSPFRFSLFALTLLLAYANFAQAQTAAVPKTPKLRTKKSKSAAKKSANVKTGTIVGIDPNALTISIKTATGETLAYHLGENTRYIKAKKESDADSFKSGDGVTLKLRKVRNQADFYVFELADSESYDWLTDLRKTVKLATIKEIGDDTLTVTIDGSEVVYTISDKTRWNRDGKEVTETAFKAGEQVAIIPRSLPSGNIMARVVADNQKNAELSKAEGAGILSGVFKSVDTQAKTITFVMDGDVTHAVLYGAETEIRLRTKQAKLSALKPGQRIAVHILHQDDGKDLATRITIEQTRRKPGAKL